ncbi:MAG: hypothetical protein KAQ62_20020, partial [Cyclobacteriaceae bacterium]|nr:hypothetical protein [Cyclobacteriaceae bacterium]
MELILQIYSPIVSKLHRFLCHGFCALVIIPFSQFHTKNITQHHQNQHDETTWHLEILSLSSCATF